MTDTLSPMEQDDALAGEYVLGVLDLAQRAEVERRLKTDAAFAERVLAWENRFAEMNDSFAPVPAPNLMPAIEARLFPVDTSQTKRSWLTGLMGLAMATVAAIAVAGFFLLVPAKPDLTARMQTADASLIYEAQFTDGQLTVARLAGAAAPAGSVHELWIIAPGAAPVSLGLLQDAPLTLAQATPPKGWVLAVTLEPGIGSQGKGPSGPVILSAEIGA